MCVVGRNITGNGTVVDVAGKSVRVLLQHGTCGRATVMMKHATCGEQTQNKDTKRWFHGRIWEQEATPDARRAVVHSSCLALPLKERTT